MDRDTFSHIRMLCPRPFGTYTQNKPRSPPGMGGKTEVRGGGCMSLGEEAGGGGGGGVEGQEEEEEEDAGSENTPPPEPDSSSSSSSISGPPQQPPPSSSSVPPTPPPPPLSGTQMEDGRVLLDTWYVIKPGNTKEKIAFFVAHQFSGTGLPRASAMKVKGNWATDCTKAKRRRRCSSYDPPSPTASTTTAHDDLDLVSVTPPESLLQQSEATTTTPGEEEEATHELMSETDLLSVAEMVALVEQRTAMALQGMVVAQGQPTPGSLHHTVLLGTVSDPSPIMFLSERRVPLQQPPTPTTTPTTTLDTTLDEQQQESRRVAQAVAHFESQQQHLLENALRIPGGPDASGREMDCFCSDSGSSISSSGGGGGGGGPPIHGRGEVRIAFRVSSLDPRSQSEPAGGRSRCMFMSCGGGGGVGGGGQVGARAKEKITCDLYQLVSPSSRDPSGLLLAGSPKADSSKEGPCHLDRLDSSSSTTTTTTPDHHPGQEQLSSGGEQKGGAAVGRERERERVTGFHVEVVVTGAVDQCVFYGKDSTENVQEETVCFAMPPGAMMPPAAATDASEDYPPPPGQLFFLQPSSRPSEEKDDGGGGGGIGIGMCSSLDCANNNNPTGGGGGGGSANEQPDSSSSLSPLEDCSDPSLCRLYRHVSHDFLEIRFQIQRLLEPRQYMLLLPDHIAVNIFGYLPTRSLAALKCTCHDFKALIELYGVRATDSRWNRDPLYRDDPCKQCKRQYERGDVSLCRWHPKPYHHDLPYGRSYWMCCRRTDKDTPGCRVGLHDNNWVQSCELVQTRAKREDGR